MRRMKTMLATLAGLLLATSAAWAQDYEVEYDEHREIDETTTLEDPATTLDDPMDRGFEVEPMTDDEFATPASPDPVTYEDPAEPALVTPMGMGIALGGGVTDYVGEAGVFTDPGGSWEARYILGTRTIIGGELAYLGTANSLETLGVDGDAILLTNGAEGALRVNFLTDEIQPYVLGGVGWKNFRVTNTATNTGNIKDVENGMTVPLGAGLSYRFSNVFADLRGMYRPTFMADITRAGGDASTNLATLSGALNLGFEF